MNNNPKEKPTRLYIRVSPQEKKKIDKLASSCGLSTAEYLRKRALGFIPKTVLPDAFYAFNQSLCELLNHELTPEIETAALKLFDDIYAELIHTQKQTAQQVREEVNEWQVPDSGLLSPD